MPVSVMPEVFNCPPSCPTFSIPRRHARRFQSPAVMPDIGNPPSVIPDIFNRESKSSPMQGHPNEGTEKQNPGFPLTTGGNDRGTRRHDRGASGHDGGTRAGMPKGLQNPWPTQDHTIPPTSCPTFSIPAVMPDIGNPPSVIPDIFNRESMVSPCRATRMTRTEKQNPGFPLTTGGNDRGGRQA